MKIKDSTFMITGGSSGLGASCVRRFSDGGAKVVIADVDDDAGEALDAELGDAVRFVHTNVVSEGSVAKAVDLAVNDFGALHGAINCAGIAIAMKVLSSRGNHDLGAFAKVIAVNLTGTFNVIRLAAEVMTKGDANAAGERGVIINTASVAAFEGQIGQAAYSASKGGIISMTLPIARELARYGIRVVTLAPGLFDTPMLSGLPEKARISLAQQIPFPSRLGRPDEYAALAQHIVENEMLNGEVIRLDGAVRMAPR